MIAGHILQEYHDDSLRWSCYTYQCMENVAANFEFVEHYIFNCCTHLKC